MQIFRANIIYTPESHRFEVIPHGFVAVSDGKVEGVWEELPAHLADIPVTDWGDRLLIPAMNDTMPRSTATRASPWTWSCCRGCRTTRSQRS